MGFGSGSDVGEDLGLDEEEEGGPNRPPSRSVRPLSGLLIQVAPEPRRALVVEPRGGMSMPNRELGEGMMGGWLITVVAVGTRAGTYTG